MKSVCFLILFFVCAMTTNAQTFPKDTFNTKSNKELSIYFIKHSSLIVKYDNQLIYIDPVSMFADFSKQPKADIILITHEHADHYDTKAIEALEKDGTIIILNEATQEEFGKGIAVKHGETIKPVPYLQLKAIPAYNITPGRENYHPKERGDNGYILTIEGLNIYIAGDTENIPELEQLKNIDIAFLPCNLPYTMTVEQAVEAAKVVRPKIFYPYHYGATDVKKIVEELKSEPEIEVRIRELQ